MTKQIERAYRSNRRRSWVLIAAVVALAAAIAVPIASGAADKNYTLLFPSPATVPAAKAASATNQTLCAGSTYTLSLTLKNTAKTVSLGSANITFPSNVTLTGSPSIVSDTAGFTLPAAANPTRTGNLVKLRELSMPKGKQLKLTVSLTSASTTGAATALEAIVKQSNDFNDSSGGANTFDPAAMPTITVASCVATIKGQLWNDSNESRTKDSFESLQRPGSAAPNDFSVVLYENGQRVATPGGSGVTLAYDATGYTFSNVPTGKSYVVCEEAATGMWKQTTGTAQTICGTALPNGWAFTLGGDVVDKDFGNAKAVQVGCAGPRPIETQKFTTSTNDSTYTVWLPDAVCDSQANGVFVFETYALGAVERVANLHGANAEGSVTVVEQMEWTFGGNAQPGAPLPPNTAARYLKYQDLPTQAVRAMEYCTSNPLANPDFDPETETPEVSNTDVFPGDHTSCLISTLEGSDHKRVDVALTKVDGYRAFP